MRTALASKEGVRTTFCGQVVRFGTKPAYKGAYPISTVLLKEIKESATDKFVADHLWFTVGKQLRGLNLQAGDVIQFDARVTPYEKGYRPFRQKPLPSERGYRRQGA